MHSTRVCHRMREAVEKAQANWKARLQGGPLFRLAHLPCGELHPDQGLLSDSQLHSPFLERIDGVTREWRTAVRLDLPAIGDLGDHARVLLQELEQLAFLHTQRNLSEPGKGLLAHSCARHGWPWLGIHLD